MAVHLLLAVRGLRARRRSALLLLCSLVVAATTLSLGLTLREQADRPWDAAFERSHGAHVVVNAPDAAALRTVVDRPDVIAASGPRAVTFVTLYVGGRTLLARAVEAPDVDAAVDRPLLVSGDHARPGGVVLEATMARTLGLAPGDSIALGTARVGDGMLPSVGDSQPVATLRVAGVSVVTSQAAYPGTQPGLLLLERSDLDRVSGGRSGVEVALRLRDPASAPAVADDLRRTAGVLATTWQERRAEAMDDVAGQRVVILTFAALLVVVATATAGMLTSGRAVANAREIAVLRCVGVTPRGAIAAAVLEHVLVAVPAAVVGWLLARPLGAAIVRPSIDLLGGPAGPAPDTAVLLAVGITVVAATCVATVVPLLSALRRPAAAALAGASAARSYGRSRLSSRVEVQHPVLALGLAAASARPGRRLLAVVTVALATAAAVASIGMDATLDREAISGPAPAWFVAASAPDLLRPVAYTLMGVLAAMAVSGLVVTTWTAAAESRRDDALLRAVGASRAQVVLRTTYAVTAVAALGAAAGVQLGLVMFRVAYAAANGGTEGAVMPNVLDLVSVSAVVVLLCALLAVGIALGAARERPAQVLRSP